MRMGFDTRWPPSTWFNEPLYPDEVEVLSDGTRWGDGFASPHWRSHVNDLLRAFIAHLRSELGCADRCVAFQIGAG